MILSVSDQAALFLMTVAIGFVLAFFYDWIRILRRIIPHHDWLTYAEDIGYWLLVSVFVFVVLLKRNYGEIRFFAIAGILLGMTLYFMTVSRLFLSVSMAVIRFIHKVIGFMIRVLLAPFLFVGKLLSYPLGFAKRIAVKNALGARRRVHQVGVIGRHKARAIRKNAAIIWKKH